MAKEAYYFSHDSNARHDPKITAMRGVYGSEGYGWFWILVEMMREADGYKLDMQSKYVWSAYAMQMQCKPDETKEFVHVCINEYELFESDGAFFWSKSLLKRMEKREEQSEKRRHAANARWSKTASGQRFEESKKIEDMQMHSKSNANAMQNGTGAMQGKERKEKGKENKSNKTISKIQVAEFVSLTEEEQQKLISEFGSGGSVWMIDKLNTYKGSNGKKYRSDYMAIRSWVIDEWNKQKGGSKVAITKTSDGSLYDGKDFGF